MKILQLLKFQFYLSSFIVFVPHSQTLHSIVFPYVMLCLSSIIWMKKRSIHSDNYNTLHKNISNNGRKTYVERNFNLVFQTTHAMNVETSSFNHCWSGKSVTNNYTLGVFVALGIVYAMHMRHILICGPSGSTVFSTISHKARFTFKKKEDTKYKTHVLTFSVTMTETFLILKIIQ